jgi:hypothetical protein
MLTYSPVCWDMSPSRSVRTNQSFEETYYFPLIHLKCHRTANVLILKVAVWQLAMLSMQSQLNTEQGTARHTNEGFFLIVKLTQSNKPINPQHFLRVIHLISQNTKYTTGTILHSYQPSLPIISKLLVTVSLLHIIIKTISNLLFSLSLLHLSFIPFNPLQLNYVT